MNEHPPNDFTRSFQALSGVVHHAATEPAAAETIGAILRSADAGCVALAGLTDSLGTAIQKRCKGVTVLREPYAARDLPAAIDAADVGVTGITFAIAQTGTLVEISTDDAVRLASSLPRTHIGVVRKQDIIDRYDDAASRIREIVARYDRHLVISFISGPSRTGDIELKLTLGVHGPEQVHAVIVDG